MRRLLLRTAILWAACGVLAGCAAAAAGKEESPAAGKEESPAAGTNPTLQIPTAVAPTTAAETVAAEQMAALLGLIDLKDVSVGPPAAQTAAVNNSPGAAKLWLTATTPLEGPASPRRVHATWDAIRLATALRQTTFASTPGVLVGLTVTYVYPRIAAEAASFGLLDPLSVDASSRESALAAVLSIPSPAGADVRARAVSGVDGALEITIEVSDAARYRDASGAYWRAVAQTTSVPWYATVSGSAGPECQSRVPASGFGTYWPAPPNADTTTPAAPPAPEISSITRTSD